MAITLFTENVDPSLRPYLILLLKLMKESPIKHTDPTITALNNFKIINSNYRVGLTLPAKSFACGAYSQTVLFSIQVEKWQYKSGVKYILAKLQNTSFNASTIKDAASQLLQTIPSSLNSEYASWDLGKAFYYKPSELCGPCLFHVF